MSNQTGKPKYKSPETIEEFEIIYQEEYEQELASSNSWIKWCEKQNPPDTHGICFHQAMQGALIFNNIKMRQLLRILKS